MRLAISNIAWDPAEDEAVVRLLSRFNIDAIDVAPSKYFPRPADANFADIERVGNWWRRRGIAITGMQSLLFGTTGLNLFGSIETQNAMLHHLNAVCRIGAGLGATRLVFGSPKNRDRSGLSDAATLTAAVTFFRRVGDAALTHGVEICLEPTPSVYGANFMTTSDETADVVTQIGHPAIRMQLDTGAMTMNGECLESLVTEHAHLIGHIHASEPNLVVLGDGNTDHERFSATVAQHLPQHLVSVEMLATRNEPHLASIARALHVAIRHYRPESPALPGTLAQCAGDTADS